MKKLIFLFPIMFVVSCQVEKKSVEQAFQKLPAPKLINPYDAAFKKNAAGIYKFTDSQNTNDRIQFTIDGNGSFEIGETKFTLHHAINDYQAVYSAAEPTKNGGKTLYTYHGIVLTPTGIATAPYKTPSFENYDKVSPLESEYYWEINTFRPENINWDSGFTTIFAERNNILEKIIKP
ncbi:MAG: hypothetical protein ACRCVW_06410 [Brevinema sp.]